MADDMDFGQPVEEGDEVVVDIDDMGSKGDGIARIEGFVIFVPETEIGETVKIRIDTVGSKFAFGKVVERDIDTEGEGYDKEELEEGYDKEETEEEKDQDYEKEEIDEEEPEKEEEPVRENDEEEPERYEKEEVEEDNDKEETEEEKDQDYEKEEIDEEPEEDPYYS